jgi:hypothetical protein
MIGGTKNSFWWRCSICGEAIKRDLTERWEFGRKVRYHKACIDKQEFLLREADRMLRERDSKH